jgi:hypothetical protein
MKKYEIDEWVNYRPFPEKTHLQHYIYRAVILEVLAKNAHYDYRIYVDAGAYENKDRVKKVKEANLFSI